jgi:hypothetical protein
MRPGGGADVVPVFGFAGDDGEFAAAADAFAAPGCHRVPGVDQGLQQRFIGRHLDRLRRPRAHRLERCVGGERPDRGVESLRVENALVAMLTRYLTAAPAGTQPGERNPRRSD